MFKISGTAAVAAALLVTIQAIAQTSSGAPSVPLAGCVQKDGDIYTLVDENSKTKVELRGGNLRAGQHIQVTGTAAASAIPAGGATQVLEVSGVRYRFDVALADDVVWVDSPFGHVVLSPVPRLPAPAAVSEPGSLVAPMPGNVVRIGADRGEWVRAGQPIVVLEAMKMEHQIVAPADGLVAEVRVAIGDQVQAGEVLAIVDGGHA